MDTSPRRSDGFYLDLQRQGTPGRLSERYFRARPWAHRPRREGARPGPEPNPHPTPRGHGQAHYTDCVSIFLLWEAWYRALWPE